MKKAVFLDRDGVVNKERGDYTYKPEQLILNNGISESIELLKSNDFLVIIISNQGGISKKIYTKADVEHLHQIIILKVGKDMITDIFYCPHHDINENCLCRKPKTLMFEKAIANYDIDTSKSYMIGDNDRDIIAGEKAGIKSIKVNPNQNIYSICKTLVSNF